MADAHGAAHLFVYGSLAFPAVWQKVVRGRYASAPARLDGYRRFAIRGETYPGMTTDPGSSVTGRLYLAVRADDLDRLDAFEGSDYRRIPVSVFLPDDGERLPACAYLYLRLERAASRDWDPVAFERDALADFLRDYPPPREG